MYTENLLLRPVTKVTKGGGGGECGGGGWRAGAGRG